jgi:hypothetical protein
VEKMAEAIPNNAGALQHTASQRNTTRVTVGQIVTFFSFFPKHDHKLLNRMGLTEGEDDL